MKTFLYRPQSVFVRRALFQVHLWVGVLAGLYIFVVCLTGAALVFRIDMQRALHPHLFTPGTGAPAEPARILESLREAYPGDGVSFVEAPTTVRPTYLAYLIRGDQFPAVLVDPVSGHVLGEVPDRSFVRTLQALHFDLLGGRTGRLVNGIGAALLLALCLTGIVIWWPGVTNWRRGFTIDLRRPWRRITWDLHSVTGISTVALVAIWGVSGVYFVWPSEFRAAVNWMSPLTVTVAPVSARIAPGDDAVRPTWRELIARAQQHAPGQQVARMVPPADDRAAFLVMFSRATPLPPARQELTPIYLDQYSGEQLDPPARGRRSAGDLIMEWAAPLHVGNFAGNGVRIAWFVLGLAPPLLFVTGFIMWWTRVVRPRWLAAAPAPTRAA